MAATIHKASSRDRILQTAIELLGTHGFASMTMRLLGDSVGLDNSSLYRHFKSKADLVNAAIDQVSDALLSVLMSRVDEKSVPSLTSLEDLSIAAGDYLYDHPSSARLMIHWFMSLGDEGPGFQISVDANDPSRPSSALLALIKDQIEAAVAAGSVRPLAMPDALIMLISALMFRPATRGYFLISLEPRISNAKAKKVWLNELRQTVGGILKP